MAISKDNIPELWKANKGLIRLIASKYPPQYSEDLIQESYFTLVKTIEHLKDEEQFIAYFSRALRSDFSRYCYKQGVYPEYVYTLRRKLARFQNQFREKHGRDPYKVEIRVALDISESVYNEIMNPKETVSLETPIYEDITIADSLADDSDFEADLVERDSAKILWKKADSVGGFLKEHYQENKTLKEIASENDLTVSKVIGARDKALKTLKRDPEISSLYQHHVGVSKFKANHTSEEEAYILKLERLGLLKTRRK